MKTELKKHLTLILLFSVLSIFPMFNVYGMNLVEEQNVYKSDSRGFLEGEFTYDLDKTNKIIYLRDNLSWDKNRHISSSYTIDGITYRTVIGSHHSSTTTWGNVGMFNQDTIVETITLDPGIVWEDNNMSYAFYGCKNLKTLEGIYIPKGTTNLSCTFAECPNLTSVGSITIPDSVTEMPAIFFGDTNLKSLGSIKVPSNVNNLINSFNDCPLTNQVIVIESKNIDKGKIFLINKSVVNYVTILAPANSKTYLNLKDVYGSTNYCKVVAY